MDTKEDKIYRILDLYTRMLDGSTVNKKEEAARFGVTEKSIQRDIKDIRAFLSCQAGEGVIGEIVCGQSGYRLKQKKEKWLENGEMLAVMKILLESRAFKQKEMNNILKKLVKCCLPPESQRLMEELCANESIHYVELHYEKSFIDRMWQIALAAKEQRCIEITYEKPGEEKAVLRKVEPLAVLFSEFYFYMAANIQNIDKAKEFQVAGDRLPTIYRIDRIKTLKVLDEHFEVLYAERFEEGEYRKRVQLMYGGKSRRVEFWYKGPSLEAVLDKLPTAKAVETDKEHKRYKIRAETIGKGVEMWLKSQGDYIEDVRWF